MTFTTPTRTAIRDKMLRDLLSQRPTADVSTDSDWYVRATAHAAAAEGLYAHQQWIARQIVPDDCDEDWLEKHASRRSIYRKEASYTSGPVTVSGVSSATLPAGLVLTRADGTAYTMTAAAVIGAGGTGTVQVRANVVGAAANADAGTLLTFSAPPAGVQATATAGALTGGEDIETWDSVRERLRWRMQNPPAGGNPADYIGWALAVPGVARAWVYPLRRGDGTVDVAIMASTGLPSSELVTAVQTAIDKVRPVMKTDGFMALAPTPVLVPIAGSVALDGTVSEADVSTAIITALSAYFAGLAPGSGVVLTRLIALIADVPGVADFSLSAPAANVATTITADAVQLAMLGTVELLFA